MIVTEVETWWCQRNEELFDRKRTGTAQMPWDVLVVRLKTDEGIESTVSAVAARSGLITEAYFHETIASVVLGRDVYDREAIWQDFWVLDRHFCFFPVFLPGPIDVALWELAALKAGLPLYKYMGAYRKKLPAYASSLWLPDPKKYVEQAKLYASKGFKAYKAHPGGPLSVNREIHHSLREEMGEDYVLMSDPVGTHSLDDAIREGRDLEKLGYKWYEEPFRDFELAKYKKLCDALDIPIACTETTRGAHWGVAQAITFGAADIVRADVSWKCGITGTIKIAHLAESHGMNCEIHTTTMGLMDVVNLHVSCAIKNCEYFEYFVPGETFRFPMKGDLPIDSEGNITVPDRPGIGVDIDWAEVDKRCVSHKVAKFEG
jgi:L-alanine-DL-glutamate epimerase-like enolase superfamily enzyme